MEIIERLCINRIEASTMEFLDMNDDCLEHVFRFLDLGSVCKISDTCKHLSRIAQGFLKKHRSYKCHIGDEENVKKASTIIRKIGQYVTELHLEFDPIDPAAYMDNGIGCRFLSLLNRSLGEQFCALQLSGTISSFPVSRLAPNFAKLQKLSIYCEYDAGYTYGNKYVSVSIDLPQLCPNLQELSIENSAVIFAPNPMKSFRNLESLEFHSYGKYYPIDSLYCFFNQNTKLRKLYVDHLVDDNSYEYIDLALVTEHLKDLEELRIRNYAFDNWVPGVRNFSDQHHLTTLVLSEYLDSVEELNDILDILKTIKQLKKILIGWCLDDIPNQQAMINVANELTQLESFQVDVQCDENTIIECVLRGRSLKRFCVEFRKDRVVTSSFIKHLAKVRKSVADASHQPLLLYFHTKLDKVVLKVLKEPDVARYLNWKVLHEVSYIAFELHSK